MKLGLSLSLSAAGRGGARLDPDTAAYIAAITAAGATVTSSQRVAIDAFYRAEKAAGRYSLLRRMYLPIWGIAAANAICMRSLTSGTFVGGVTHGSGSVSTTSPTGHFLADATPAALGLSSDNASIFSAAISGPQVQFMGCGGASNSRLLVGLIGSTRSASIPSTGSLVGSGSDTLGIMMASRVGSVTSLYQRKQTGWIAPESLTTTDTTALPAFAPAFLGNFNSSGVVSTGRTSVCTYIAYGYGLGLTSAQAEPFTANLKTLWETCTGLTIPA